MSSEVRYRERHRLTAAVAMAAGAMLLVGKACGADNQLAQQRSDEVTAAKSETIIITINPEARIGVARKGALLALAKCGIPAQVPVLIRNDGFLTAVLTARLIGSVPKDLSVEFDEIPLSGARLEWRVLRITLDKSGLVDIAIAFLPIHHSGEMTGEDQINFLMNCQS